MASPIPQHLLSPTLQRHLLHSILTTWSPKLHIDGAAKLTTSSVSLAETLAQYISSSHLDQAHSITILSSHQEKEIDPVLAKLATISTTAKIPDDSITHAFAHVERYTRHDALWTFKRIFYSLIPKGIVIVTCWRRNPLVEVLGGGSASGAEEVKDGDLGSLAEEAQFERGKIRSFREEVVLKGEELEEVLGEVRVGLGRDGRGLTAAADFDDAIKKSLGQDGSLTFEAEVILAMRWDLLCA